jgi:NAD(P)-dependent dehydrogenase (short-subunit alcohol dehydrogenase family)
MMETAQDRLFQEDRKEMRMDDRQKVALVTGSASGIGKACAQILRDKGFRVIGVDLQDADIEADLSNAEGRERFVSAINAQAPEGLDLAVIAAGIAYPVGGKILAVNFFGAVSSVEAVRALLAQRTPSQAIMLISIAAMDDVDSRLVEGCLAGDEAAVLLLAAQIESPTEYASSKRALGLWLRRAAVRPEWGGSGIHLNGVAPGITLTGMTRPLLAVPEIRQQIEAVSPRVVDWIAEPDAQAEAIVAIAGLAGNYMFGQIVYVDGGTDAIRRPELV